MGLLRKYVLYQFRLKAMALVLALMLWFSMTYLGESKMVFSVPVSFEHLNKAMVVREVDSRDVLVTLDGPLSVLKNLTPHDINVALDLSRSKEGRQIFTIKKDDVFVPSSVKIESIKPDYVVLGIDKIVEKELPTVVKLDGKWANTYQVASWSPRTVKVEGSRELLGRLDAIETLPVDGAFKRSQETLDVPLNTKPLEGGNIRPGTVRVVLRRIGGR